MKIQSSWDDGSAEDVRLAELMTKHNIEAVFYWPVRWKSVQVSNGRSFLTREQAEDIAHEFEIGSHTLTHPLLTRIPLGRARTEIFNSRRELQQMFDQPIYSFCPPRGYSNPSIQHLISLAGYTHARNTEVGTIKSSPEPLWTSTSLHVGVDRKEYGGLDWLTYGLALLGEAKKRPDSVFHFWGHGYEIEERGQWDRLNTLLEAMA